MTLHVLRLPLSLDPVIAEAKRRARQRRLLLSVVAVLIAGAALGAAFAVRSSNGSGGAGAGVAPYQIANPLPDGAADCGRGVSGPGFRVWACMSGGARAGHPHPKELLVARSDGSSSAYPAFGGQDLAAGDGEVVAVHDLNLVKVTSSRLVPLVTTSKLARALHVRPPAILWPMYDLRVDAHGDVYFVVSAPNPRLARCRNPLLERTATGTIRQIRASISRGNICS
jgi:hypothetical protein